MNTWKQLMIIFSAALSAGMLIVNGANLYAQETREEFIKFSHEYHIDGMGVDCTVCHEGITQSRKSSDHVLPGHSDCSVCHDGLTARDDCLVCHYSEEDIKPSPKVEREILFNHEMHLGFEDIECTSCHVGLEATDYAVAENLPDMPTCITCHNNAQAPQNCEFCHTQLPTLRPNSHTPTWINRHDEALRATSQDCSTCHQFNFCQECHDGAVLIKSSLGNLSNVPPTGQQNWNIRNMVLQRNHDLNYMFIHPIEARNNQQKCQLCHESESFCNTCHASGDYERNILPAWHGGAGWGAIALARGSGGGRHAQMAKQDISLCVSCHDANGEDPECLLCHMDRTPGRNNDLRTHTANLKRGVFGPWHNDPSYMCFTCHISARPKDPAGFCGYCHAIK